MINEIVTGTMYSATTTSSSPVSDIIIGDYPPQGSLTLECQVSGSSEWFTISNVRGVMSLSTPDNSITYRFRCENIADNVQVYFGP